ncbi:unnamed protein product, partial [marine sediment metagenome]
MINVDDPHGKELANRTKAKILSYAIDRPADITGEIKQMSLEGTMFRLETPRGKVNIKTGLIGRFNVYNLLGATGVGLAMGIGLETIKSAIAEFKGVERKIRG